MRKIAIVVLLLVAAAGGALWFFTREQPAAVQPAQLLPQETLVMIEAVDLKESLDAFRAGPLGRALAHIDWPACMQAFNAAPEEILQVQQLQARVTAAVESLWFDALFGDLAVIAVLAPEPQQASEPVETLWRQTALMVLQPRKSTEMIQWIGKMFAGDVTISPVNIDGIRMDKVETADVPPLFVAAHRNLMLAALDPAPIARCLTPGGEGGAKLADAPDFARLRDESKLPGTARSFAWIDLHGIFTQWMDPLRGKGVENSAANQALKLWAEFTRAKPVLAAAAADDGEISHQRWRLRYHSSDLPPEAARLLDIPPQHNATLPWIPDALLYYGWHNNLRQVIESVADLSRLDADQAAAFRQKFTDSTGVRLEDALNACGSQFALLIRDVETGGMFPVPVLALMAEVGQPEVIRQLVENAVAKSGLALATENYGQTPIRYLDLSYGPNISPAYAFREGFWMVASNRQLLKTLLASAEPEPALVQDPLFKALDRGLSAPNNKMAFFRVDHIANRTKALLTWGVSLAMMSGKVKNPDQLRYLSENVLAPILDALSTYRAMGSRTVNEENAVQADAYTFKPSQK